MMPTSAHGITLDHIFDDKSAWKINHSGKVISSYTFMRPGRADVTITRKGLMKIDARLPDVMKAPEKETTIEWARLGLIVRAHMQMWNDLAPKDLGNVRICTELENLYGISRVSLLDASTVRLSGNFLRVDRTSREYPFITDIDYFQERFVRADVFEAVLPGSINRLSLLESLAVHPARIMVDIFSTKPIPEALPLPESLGLVG